ncbi:uncharacterized protein [Saccopteryx leptura]|uniref:uncharacterized protein isoform X2 n=1 Tax=Saccopteryx leptura TaxID=249018 RepID=UPI00339C01AA
MVAAITRGYPTPRGSRKGGRSHLVGYRRLGAADARTEAGLMGVLGGESSAPRSPSASPVPGDRLSPAICPRFTPLSAQVRVCKLECRKGDLLSGTAQTLEPQSLGSNDKLASLQTSCFTSPEPVFLREVAMKPTARRGHSAPTAWGATARLTFGCRVPRWASRSLSLCSPARAAGVGRLRGLREQRGTQRQRRRQSLPGPEARALAGQKTRGPRAPAGGCSVAGPPSGRGRGGGRGAARGARAPGHPAPPSGCRSLLPASAEGFVASKFRDRLWMTPSLSGRLPRAVDAAAAVGPHPYSLDYCP